MPMLNRAVRIYLFLVLVSVTLFGADFKIALEQSEYRVRAGETVSLRVASESASFATQATRIETHVESPSDEARLGVGRDPRTGELFLAAPLTIQPGTHQVSFSITDKAGYERDARLQVQVEPLEPVQQANRPPVVLLNGFSFSLGCPPESGSSETFGNLATYLFRDGAPAVYFFDNCRECANCTIAGIGNSLRRFLDGMRYSNGVQIQQFDVVGFSMGGLIVRSYLSGKQNAPDVFDPPESPKVRKAVFIGTPQFGSGLANFAGGAGSQAPDLRLGSRFLWDLSRWNQGADDLREVDAVAVVGSDGVSGGAPMLGDGVVALTSSSLSFALPSERTRIVPYCHIGPGLARLALTCQGPFGLAEAQSEQHLTARIVRSFLGDTSEWRFIGTTPSDHPVLSRWGGVNFAFLDSGGNVMRDVRQVDYAASDGSAGRLAELASSGVFFSEWMPAGQTRFTVYRGTESFTVDLRLDPGRFNATSAKFGPIISRTTPAAGLVGTRSLAPGSLVSIYGIGLAKMTATASTFPWPDELGGAIVGVNNRRIPILFAGPNQINAYLPLDVSGLVKLGVWNNSGSHIVNLLIEDAVPAMFSRDGTGSGPASALNAVTNELLTPANPLRPGDIASLFVTGLGQTLRSGGLDWALHRPLVVLGGFREAEVLFAGSAPGFLGLYQINFRVPPSAPRGPAIPVAVTANGRTSNHVTLNVQ